MELLDRSGVTLQGKRAVVIGRSNLVGMPVAMLLQHRNATVTVVHSKTTCPWQVVREADVVVAAVGKACFITKEWLKPGCVVIDVGINSVEDASTKKGYKLVGDVDYEGAKTVASQITPVPGGVGPMTIAMLLRNTINAYKRSLHKESENKKSQNEASEDKASANTAS
jgi:5,10-methylene-tetrahydrofolate dehydrogenase/methenyl tetrahydrofolate cyclohydrolase